MLIPQTIVYTSLPQYFYPGGTLEKFSGLREPLHKYYYIYSSRYVSAISKL
jgi:hypothetical protein